MLDIRHYIKVGALFIFTLIGVAGYSQNTINNYKYVIVPERFDFSKADDQYGLNTRAKLLLEQKGFVVFWAGKDVPPAVAANKCNALQADVTQRKGMFSTNLTFLLKDCDGNTIFKSKEGKSREKEFEVAYDLALKDAFVSLNDVPYKYDSSRSVQQTQQPVTTAAVSPSPAPAATSAAATSAAAKSANAPITGTLYAQAIPNGFQLIDTTPKKVLTLLKTSTQDCFIAEAAGANGIVIKKDGEWLFEYYKDDKLVSQKLEIKF
ncbi:hypothetical protein [Puia sp.]|jgi:biotin carboxyl carrier protein|uniref:hypothetical protein n=1 Tax=Puia sp. TaxID=2045100 RepID=UPI002F413116